MKEPDRKWYGSRGQLVVVAFVVGILVHRHLTSTLGLKGIKFDAASWFTRFADIPTTGLMIERDFRWRIPY